MIDDLKNLHEIVFKDDDLTKSKSDCKKTGFSDCKNKLKLPESRCGRGGETKNGDLRGFTCKIPFSIPV
jgi:predicted Zn-ribbon and HTH transcriptional regulator